MSHRVEKAGVKGSAWLGSGVSMADDDGKRSCARLCACVHACVCARVHAYTCVHVQTCVHAHVCPFIYPALTHGSRTVSHVIIIQSPYSI